MKTIYFVRHAKAVSDDNGGSDADRRLTKKGNKEAQRMARRLKERGIRPDLIISSPANRARETASIFADTLEYPPLKIKIRPELYPDPTDEDFLKLIRSEDPSVELLMIFGHEPSLSRFASSMDGRFAESFPKAGVAAFRFDVPAWIDIEAENGVLHFFDIPESPKKARRVYEESVRRDVEASILEVLNRQDPHTTEGMRKFVRKTCEKIVGHFIDSLEALSPKKAASGDRKPSGKRPGKIRPRPVKKARSLPQSPAA